MSAFVYILRCCDGSYYVGSTRTCLEERIAQHSAGSFGGYTARRRPVVLLFSQHFDQITDAISAERQLKGWSRAKKEALIAGDFSVLRVLSKRRSFETKAAPSPQDEVGQMPHAEERALARVSKQGCDDFSSQCSGEKKS